MMQPTGRAAATLGGAMQAMESALAERYAPANPFHEPVAEVLDSDGSWMQTEVCAGERTIEVAVGPMQESPRPNGSPHMAVEQTVELVLRQAFEFADPGELGPEAAADDRRDKRREFLNWVGDVVAFCHFLSAPGLNEFGPVRYVQGGPIGPDSQDAKEFQWYVELAVPLSLELSDSPASARLSLGTYTGPVPFRSMTWDYEVEGLDLEPVVVRP